MGTDRPEDDDDAPSIVPSSILHRLNIRILSIGYVIVLLSFVNRNNVGFAANDLCSALHLSNAQYGLGITILSTGFMLSRLVGNRCSGIMGAPKWFALTALVWGAAGIGLGFVQETYQFYMLSGILGFAQGDAYPGMMQYLSHFYPPKFLDGAFAAVTGAIALSIPFTSVLSAAIVSMAEGAGIEGWRLMLTVEGALPVLFSVVVFVFLPERYDRTTFLEAQEVSWLATETKQEQTNEDVAFSEIVKEISKKGQIWLIALAMLGAVGAEHSLMFFTNLVIRTVLDGPEANHEESCGSSGNHQMASIALTAIPYICSWLACVVMGRYADRVKNRKWFAVSIQTASGLLLALWIPLNAVAFIAGFLAVTLSVGLSFPPQVAALSLAATSVSPAAAPTALALITTVFSMAALVFPMIVGYLADGFGYGWGMIFCGILSTASGLTMIGLSDPDKKITKDRLPLTNDEESDDDACRPLIEESTNEIQSHVEK